MLWNNCHESPAAIPTFASYFCRIRDEHTILEDKTASLVALRTSHKVFLARPRRMGKALLHTAKSSENICHLVQFACKSPKAMELIR